MCGRFVRGGDSSDYAEALGVTDVPPLEASWNIAPTQTVLTATLQDGQRQAALQRFGMVPFWSRDGKAFINVRSDTLAAKPTFKAAFKHRRCLIAASGYYEWSARGKQKQPYFFRLRNRRPFVFAGLWDTWQEHDGCAIITTEPNELQRPIHDRMPVILPAADVSAWLDPTADSSALLALLVPYVAELMEVYPVNKFVGSVKNNDPSCIEAVPA
jgi:putative SOS response-associated peptidase YedK